MASERSEIIKERQDGLLALEKHEYQEAEVHLRKALALTEAQRNAETYMLMQRLAESLMGQGKGRLVEAEQLLQKARLGFSRFGQDDEDFLDCLYLLAECYCEQRKFSEAQDMSTTALTGLESNLKRGPEHATTLKCRGILALARKNQGAAGEASELAKADVDQLDAVSIRMRTNETVGSRRLSNPEIQALQKAELFAAKVLGAEKVMVTNSEYEQTSRFSSKSTVPSGSEPSSRAGSKQSVASK